MKSPRFDLVRVAAFLFGFSLLTPLCATARADEGPVKVTIAHEGGSYQLRLNGHPFYIKGAGLEFGSPEKLAEHGGNSFRTWRTENGQMSGQKVLDGAWKNHLYVTMGLDVARERHGFDYNDPRAVARQLEAIKREVIKYRDHPALIIWCIGNELNLNSRNPAVWNAVNDISRMIHELDPNHLTTTAVAGLNKDLVQQIKARAPDLDLLCIQMYADIVNLPRYLREAGWTGPYIVSEWGATGHWEIAKTDWGAPVENDSTTKADFYLKRFRAAIEPDHTQCLGSYVFLWGQKQERTPTWYGMFLESGEETATVDTMHFIWNGQWPANQSPRIKTALLDGKRGVESVHVRAGGKCEVFVEASDPDHDVLRYRWEVMEESKDTKTGGDRENKPARIETSFRLISPGKISFSAPGVTGAYRLFCYIYDGQGHAAHVNIPFYVDSSTGGTQSQTAGN